MCDKHYKTLDMKKFFSYLPILLLGFGLLFSGCIDDKFDEPPIDGEDPNITPNATIEDVLNLRQPGQIVEITDDLIVDGIVISSDEAGNFYKTLVIEDESAGIRLSIDRTGLYNDYPKNRHVYVKLKGLYIGDYHELPTIGAGVGTSNSGNTIIERIPSALLNEYVIKGKKNQASPIREKTIAEVSLSDVNRLIRLTDVEFVSGNLGKQMADGNQDANRTLTDCSGNTLDMRNSHYSNFADATVPDKHGSVEAVVGIYNTTMQLGLSYYEDMNMTEDRCTGGGGGTVGDWTILGTSAIVDSVHEDFNALNDGDDVMIDGWLNATDVANGRYWSAKTYQTDKYIQASAYHDDNALTHSWVITPGVTNIQDKILSFRSAWGFGSLEHILKVYVSTDFDGSDIGAATWTEINPTVATQASGEHQWVNSGDYPLSAFTGTGYVAFEYTGSSGNSPSSLRVDDVVINTTGSGGGGTGGNELFKEQFEGLTDDAVLDLTGWINIAEVGPDADRWYSNSHSGNGFAEAQGYGKTGPDLKLWLVTPPFDATSAVKLNFKSAMHHWEHDGFSVWISNDFDGTNLTTANWQEVTCTLPVQADGNYTWIPSGDIHLQDYFSTDNVRVAFKFVGNVSSQTTGYRIDDVILVEE